MITRISSTIVAAFASCLATFAAYAQDMPNKPRFGPPPPYVARVQPPPFRESDTKQASDGVAYLLLDSQDLVERDRYWSYRRTVKRVIDRVGLEGAGRLEFVFDPTQEKLTIHAINVLRGGQTINRLDGDGFTIIRREEDLADGVIDGQLTAYFEIPDIRVGDTIDFEVSWLTKSPLWPGEYFADFSVEWSTPVGLFHRSITTPAEKPLKIVNFGNPPQPTESRSGGAMTYVWRRERPPVVRGEDAVPVTHSTWSGVGVSTLHAWSDVVASLAADYERHTAYPATLAARFAGTGDLNRRITDAVRYVQDEIRYVADETGVGSHLPRTPETVVARGWGDCKDKALLLAAILRAMGVEAYVALTDNDAGNALPLKAPSPFAFDHAITLVTIGGRNHWIDATYSHQGGIFPNIAPPPVGNALPIKAGVGGIWPVTIEAPDTPYRKTTETFDFENASGEGVDLSVTTIYRDIEADAFRRKLSSTSLSSLAEDYIRYYERLYPGIKSVAELNVLDDRDANEMTVKEHYRLDKDLLVADGLNAAFPLQADAIRNAFDEINASSRRAPIALPFPYHAEHVVHLKNTGVEMDGIEEFSKATPEFEFVRNAMPEDDSVWISWRLRTLKAEAPAERIADYAKVVGEMNDWNIVEYNLASGDEDDKFGVLALAALVAFAVFSGLAVWAAVESFKEDGKTVADSILHPMSVTKFVVVGILTAGIYSAFWMYRCWRHEKITTGRDLSPFWRAFFAIFYVYPLFSLIRSKMPEGDRPPVAAGVAIAALYAGMIIIFSVHSAVSDVTGITAVVTSIIEALAFLIVTPLLFWTNQLNRDRPQLFAAHSRWSLRTVAAIGFGLSFWALIIVGSLSPD